MHWNSQAASTRFVLGLILCFLFVQAGVAAKPLPDAVVRAHTVFLENDTGFNELEYSTIFELTKWGRFDLVDTREKADLVMRLESSSHVRVVPDGQFPSNGGDSAADTAIPPRHTRISLIDPKTNAVLWSDTHKTDGGKVKNGHLLDGLREAFDAYEKSHL